ncbi:MAG: hypothetical protein IAX21_06365 [Candidatus Bathyarchaeota archaeon]|nr:hypothetical protein [Candidatus Bathyarchaeum tardum]WGM89424.1 MAG: hypothetical protein NUK63_11065 [Candidatus Bathyarchaeum tardum]WNZ28297.1 MAG: hypothetical protein IAX21_06365 [Candidatus Bathyarchaeota archaeon]
MISDVLPYAIAVGAIIVALITIYITRNKKDETSQETKEVLLERDEILPLKGQRTVTPFDAQKSKKELRLLDVEREILSFGIRRIYEAHAEGKIDEKERDRLARNYKQQMREIKDSITEKESVVALHELESMQEDLIKLFNDRFDEINQKIGGLRSNLQIIPKPVEPKPERSTSAEKTVDGTDKTPKKKKEPSKPRKTEAEEKIDKIRSEVEKVLERLGQMETEA